GACQRAAYRVSSTPHEYKGCFLIVRMLGSKIIPKRRSLLIWGLMDLVHGHAMPSSPDIQAFFDEATNTVSYLLADPASRQAAIIDPVLDYDPHSGAVSTASADRMLAAARAAGLQITWILETHAHADHLSAAHYLKALTGAPVAIGEHIREVQRIFGRVFNLHDVSGE